MVGEGSVGNRAGGRGGGGLCAGGFWRVGCVGGVWPDRVLDRLVVRCLGV